MDVYELAIDEIAIERNHSMLHLLELARVEVVHAGVNLDSVTIRRVGGGS